MFPLDGGEDRVDMQMLVRGDDHCVYFGSVQKFPEIPGYKIGIALVLQEVKAVLLKIRDPDEIHHRVASGDLAAEQADAARPDDREADSLRLLFQVISIPGARPPARYVPRKGLRRCRAPSPCARARR